MELVKSYPGGTLTAEIFELLFPDRPEVVLMDYLKTGQEILTIFIPIGNDKNGDPLVCVARLDRGYAQKLLDEFAERKNEK